MKLTKIEATKVCEVTTEHDYEEKYMVVLNEGYANEGEEVGFFNTQKDVKAFIKGAELCEKLVKEYAPKTAETVAPAETVEYTSFYSNIVTAKDDVQTIETAREGQYFNGYTTMRLMNLREGVEGRDLVLDTVLKELVGYRKELANGHKVDVYVKWTLTEDRMEYATCKAVKTVVSTFKTNRERLDARCKALGYKLATYDKDLDKLDEKAFGEVVEWADESYKDLIVESKGKTYVVEISTVDNEKDFILYTKSSYISKYNNELFDDYE